MVKFLLQKIGDNQALSYFLQKPDFLSVKDESRLLNFINSKKLDKFYDYASKLIRNSRDVANLYVYLLNKMEAQGISNKKIKNHACWRLFNISSVGWLGLHDPEIIKYCQKNTTDKILLKELKKVKTVKWFKKYLQFIGLEKQITYNIGDIEKNVSKYLRFVKKLLKDRKIKQEEFDRIMGRLQEETIISKGWQTIGSLISKHLQKKIGRRVILPKVNVHKYKKDKA